MQKICCLRMSTGRRKDEGEKTKAKRRKDESEKTKAKRRKRKDEKTKAKRRKRKDESEKTKRQKRKDESEKTLNSGLQGASYRLHVFVISLFRLRYFVMSPSLFRLFVFSLSSFRYGAFVLSPRNNEKTKWHKSATNLNLMKRQTALGLWKQCCLYKVIVTLTSSKSIAPSRKCIGSTVQIHGLCSKTLTMLACMISEFNLHYFLIYNLIFYPISFPVLSLIDAKYFLLMFVTGATYWMYM